MKKSVSPVKLMEDRPRRNFGPLSVLSQLLFKMMREQGLRDLTVWERYMTRFVSDPLNGLPTANSGQRPAMNSARGNLRKELMKEKISWRVFCKGLRFLTLESFDITITATYKSGHVKTFTETVVLATGEAADEINNGEDEIEEQ